MPSAQDIIPSTHRPKKVFSLTSPMRLILQNLHTLFSATPHDRRKASKLIYTTEYDLLALNQESPNDRGYAEGLATLEAVSLNTATHLYFYLVLREIPKTSQMIGLLVERLRTSLEDYSGGEWESDEEKRKFLAWILFVGAAEAEGRARIWFVTNLKLVCELLGVKGKVGLEGLLKQVLWHDQWCGEHMNNVWGAVIPPGG
jgi:hypothetical protein